ncbi:MAG: tRNA1(Val) (adenine(37)-N6)-methyltransferase [Beijerinckiaceae bacterium]
MAEPGPQTIETTLLAGRLRLRQLETGHRAGTDAVLLAACIGAATGTLADIGAGVGAAGLAVAQRNPDMNVLLAELEPDLAAVAEQNIERNGLSGRARVVCADILSAKARAAAGLADNCADILVTNPPYQAAAASRVSPDPLKARAHTLPGSPLEGLDLWLRACAAMLRPGGTFAMIHRADALGDVISACGGRFGALRILPVHSKAGRAAIRILVKGVAGSRAGLSILPGLTLHESGGGFTPPAAAIHAGEALLDFGI